MNNRWSGYDTDTDMGSPGGYVAGGNPKAMKFCDCDRGKQLKALTNQGEKQCYGKIVNGACVKKCKAVKINEE